MIYLGENNSWGGGEVGNEEMSFGGGGGRGRFHAVIVCGAHTHFYSSELLTQREAKLHCMLMMHVCGAPSLVSTAALISGKTWHRCTDHFQQPCTCTGVY